MINDRIHDGVPVRVLDVELGDGIDPIDARVPGRGRGYAHVRALVRLHTVPLGFVALELNGGLDAHDVARAIWAQLGPQIREHMVADGLAEPTALPIGGLAGSRVPECRRVRDAARDGTGLATVVVATRERPSSLRRCLSSLLELDYRHYEILVVDNAPQTSETFDVVTSEPFADRVRYLREDRRGLAAAHNCGLAAASGAFVAFTDDDVTADPGWLLELAAGFREAEDVACVTGMIVPAELETHAQLVAEQLWGWNKGFSQRLFDGSTHGGDPLYPYAAGTFGSGANMAFDTGVLRDLGGFDAAIGIGTPARGGDDLAAFYTVISSGYRLVYNPSALVRHTHHRDYAALRRQAFGYGTGLTAYLTKTLIEQPRVLLEPAWLGGHGLTRALSPRRGATGVAQRHGGSPDLARRERLGMLWGPAAYLWSRRRTRRGAGAVDAQRRARRSGT